LTLQLCDPVLVLAIPIPGREGNLGRFDQLRGFLAEDRRDLVIEFLAAGLRGMLDGKCCRTAPASVSCVGRFSPSAADSASGASLGNSMSLGTSADALESLAARASSKSRSASSERNLARSEGCSVKKAVLSLI